MTEVLLTVDLEFSSGGYFDDPTRYQPVGPPSVELMIDGESHGLGFLLQTLEEYGAAATFFVETAQVLCFGLEPMGGIVRRLAAAGQDLQLHFHPQWLSWEAISADPNGGVTEVCDSMAQLDDDAIRKLFRIGVDAFSQWGLRDPVAFRAGNLEVEDHVYNVMSELGLTLGSNIGLGVYRPRSDGLQLTGGRHRVGGILELPILTYTGLRFGFRARRKSLTITGSSTPETIHLLEAAHEAGVEQIVVLTHAHEMIRRQDARYLKIAKNGINQRRLRRLCEFVSENADRFRFATFGEKAREWLDLPDTGNPSLSTPNRLAFAGMLQNKWNDLLAPR